MRTKTSPRDVLSENLRSLMAARPGLDTIRKVAAASNSTLSNGKVGRIYAASHTTDIDTLQHLADVFGLEPWQLLVHGLNPAALPRLADAAVLNEILDAVRGSVTTTTRKANIPTPAHPVQPEPQLEEAGNLSKVLERTEGESRERSKDAGIQKPGTRRRA